MAQKTQKLLPLYVNTDAAYDKMLPDETPFAKGLQDTTNNNPDLGIGTNNPSKFGQNTLVLTPVKSNQLVDGPTVPDGYNKNIGSFECVITKELYWLNYNSNGNHSVNVLDGNTGIWHLVVQDPKLGFTDDQEAFMAPHRCSLRAITNAKGEIVEKILLITDGQSWQKWILVNTGIATDGFDPVAFPYFAPPPPHFDRREVLEWAVRPVMYNPTISTIPNTPADKGKINRLADTAFQIAVSPNYTDGRPTALSPYSLPLIVNTSDFLNNPDNLPKNALVKIYAGGVWVESMDIYVRQSKKQDTPGVPSILTWDDWKWIDRVYKFGNEPNIFETPFWLRQNPWANNNYDTTFNTFEYIFDNSRLALPALIDTTMLQNDLPQLSVGHSTLGDAEALTDNRYGYNNLSTVQLSKFDVTVQEKEIQVCKKDTRKVRLYAYVGRPGSQFSYISQVGYYLGTDTQERFGGTITGRNDRAGIDAAESKFFQLDFADKKAFRCYFKGTPFFADGKWFQVNSDNSLFEIANLLDATSADVQQYIQSVFVAGGYFVCVFDFEVPSDRYIACIGRHNIESSGDYRNTSTYVYGIANSRVKSQTALPAVNGGVTVTSIKPNAIGTFSKEMEIDCTAGDVDVWGNNADLFYIYCPDYESSGGAGNFRFIEGYFEESQDDPLPVELFPYELANGSTSVGDDTGQFTDKNGFYWGKTKIHDSDKVNTRFTVKLNCGYPYTFDIPTSQAGIGWRVNNTAYLNDNNSGVVGDCNRVIYSGRITSLDGSVGYSNIAISIKDGSTVYTDADGNFTLIIHNGQSTLRASNIYVNAGGNFRITIANCGQVPLFTFNESLVPCINCQVRTYPVPLNLAVNAEGGSQTSVKENATYQIGIIVADYAGRLGFENRIKTLSVPSFLQRNDILATFFQAVISGQVLFEDDIKWAALCVSKQTNILGYLDWVGDKIQYIDSNGNVVSDPASAVFCAIYIDSLYKQNIANNFSLLASYQYKPNDRLRILDDGDGNLLNTATFGDPIDLQILGTNYNQAAMTAQIIPNTQNPVVNVNVNNTTLNTSVTLFVRYDARLDKLLKKTGFWIETYTPGQVTDKIPYQELDWRPVVNGEIAEFTGYGNAGQPTYNYPATIDIPYWDTYLFNRNINIPGVGVKFLNHPFNSPNVNDNWGANLTSGGREQVENPNAKQLWYGSDVTRSDNYVDGSSVNGLGVFRRGNRKDFSFSPAGRIMAMIASRNMVIFICENSWFVTNYNFHFAYPNEQGVLVVNLNGDLSQPFERVGDDFGCEFDDTGTVIINDKFVYWYNKKNAAFVICDYNTAKDISDITDEKGGKHGIKSYLIKKTDFISNWNLSHDKKSRFDVIGSVDMVGKNVFWTFRPRRKNSNDLTSYVNQRTNWQLNYQETLVYNYEVGRWVPNQNYCAEGYGTLRGSKVGIQLYAFAAGLPYSQNNMDSDSFLNFFGQNTEPVLAFIINMDEEIVKVLQNVSLDSTMEWLFDMIYDKEENSYSYIPVNLVKKKENNFYAAVMRDMTSYLDPAPDQSFRSTIQDGKRIFSNYFFVRIVGKPTEPNKYRQLNDIFPVYTNSPNNKK